MVAIELFLGIILPFIGTALGSAMVFLIKSKINAKIEKILLGFASGVMIAASIWSLLLPSIEMAIKQSIIPFVPASVGLFLGVVILLFIDGIIFKINKEKYENIFKKRTMMILAITLHNIPEGMAVGVIYAFALTPNSSVTMSQALTLAIGIAIQNIPEGSILSMPLIIDKKGKIKAFICGILSGIVEPIFTIITILISQFINPILPYMLSFAAGAMIYVVIDDLIPKFGENIYKVLAIISFTIGFLIMMILDVALG